LVAGLDFSANGRFRTFGSNLALSGTATYYTKYTNQFADLAPSRSVVGTFGSPVRWRGRADLNYERSLVAAGFALNYTHSYTNDVRPLPNGTLQRVPAFVTLDFNARADLSGLGLRGGTLRLGAVNIFDRDPPFVNNAFGFDNLNADARGRTVYAQINYRF